MGHLAPSMHLGQTQSPLGPIFFSFQAETAPGQTPPLHHDTPIWGILDPPIALFRYHEFNII